MSVAKIKHVPTPRYWTDVQVVAYLGCCQSWFSANKENLYTAGMPRPDKLLGGKTDSEALKSWCHRRSGLVDWKADTSDADPFAERLAG